MHLPIACPKDQQRISNRFIRISVIQVEVQHVPVNDKPHVAEAGEQNHGIPELGPPPNVMISPGVSPETAKTMPRTKIRFKAQTRPIHSRPCMVRASISSR